LTKIKVLLVDNYTLFRQGLHVLLGAEQDLEVVGEATNAGDAVTLSLRLQPDVVLIEAVMSGMDGFEATRQIRKERHDTKVMFLSMYDDEEYVIGAMEVGAVGYALKSISVDKLLIAIREVAAGGSYLAPRLLARSIKNRYEPMAHCYSLEA
jgi:DNA-binding NarL/FixJ family response regulator